MSWSSCAKKEAVVIDIQTTSRKSDKNFSHIRLMGGTAMQIRNVEPVQPVLMNICQVNTYRKH